MSNVFNAETHEFYFLGKFCSEHKQLIYQASKMHAKCINVNLILQDIG